MRPRHHAAATGPLATCAGQGTSCTGSRNGFLIVALVLAVAACVLPPTGVSAGPHGKRQPDRTWHGYGFLPGYQPPEVIEWERMRNRPPTYWYGGPRFYKGRWNGGGFGPCWTATPIGPHWNCG